MIKVPCVVKDLTIKNNTALGTVLVTASHFHPSLILRGQD
jgi:hypothetical protein